MALTLYGSTQSRTFRALWMLEELGIRYDHVPAAPRSDAVRALNPSGKVPVLVEGDTVIPDSTAILTYLADRHGALTAPAGTPARARQDGWTFRILDEIDALLWCAARHSFVLPEDQRVPAVKDSLKAEYARNLGRILDEMAGPYIMGAEFNLPDILLTHCGGWARGAKFPDGPPDFAAYLERCQARPAFRRAVG